MSSRQKTIILDVDGTFYDEFKRDDKEIIREIFGSNPLVSFVDFILQHINSLDFFTNSMWILKVRLWLYSLLSLKSYKKVLNSYKERYVNRLNDIYFFYSQILYDLSVMNHYKIIFITNNEFSLYSKLAKNFECRYFKNGTERKKGILDIKEKYRVVLMAGNNYSDDYLKAKELCINFLYVGSSKLVIKLAKVISVADLPEVVFFIKKYM